MWDQSCKCNYAPEACIVRVLTICSIHEHFQKIGVQVKKGDELGHFQFGGSSIIVAFQEERINFDNDLLQLSKQRIQVLVEVGMSLGRATRSTRRDEMSPKPTYAEVADPNA